VLDESLGFFGVQIAIFVQVKVLKDLIDRVPDLLVCPQLLVEPG
jgi:hypothetical protein